RLFLREACMTNRTKAALALTVLLAGAAFLAVRVSAGGARHPHLRARLDLVERHFADLTTSSDTVEARLQALAARVADLEARLAECLCVPPPTCTPCTCAAAGAACGQDADGDGVDDCLDRCPCQPGPSAQAGCPLPPPPPATTGTGAASMCAWAASASTSACVSAPPASTAGQGRHGEQSVARRDRPASI